MRARKKAEQFWLMLGQTAHDQGVDALELFEPVLDLSFMLSQCDTLAHPPHCQRIHFSCPNAAAEMCSLAHYRLLRHLILSRATLCRNGGTKLNPDAQAWGPGYRA